MRRFLAHDLKSGVSRTEDVIADSGKRNSAAAAGSFKDFDLNPDLQLALERNGFRRPSPVQSEAIPAIRLGFDALVQSKSGTGKTLVFAVAVLEAIDLGYDESPQGLVLAPTREIAVQAAAVMMRLSDNKVKVAALIGGFDPERDLAKLRKCHVVVGTPGRVKHQLMDGNFRAEKVKILALDEADKMVQDSFLEDVNVICDNLPESKQTLALSATFPPELTRLVERFMRNPRHVRPAKDDQVLIGVSQFCKFAEEFPLNKVSGNAEGP